MRTLIFAAFGLWASVSDLKTKKVSRRCTVPMLAICVTSGCLYSPFITLTGAFTGFLVFFAVRCFTKNRLGFADVLVSAASGAYLGFENWLYSTLLSCCAAALVLAAMLFVQKKGTKQTRIAFVPYLVVPSLLTALAFHFNLFQSFL